jgi:hypothetical protein
LDDLAVVARVEMPQIVTIQQKNLTFFAGGDSKDANEPQFPAESGSNTMPPEDKSKSSALRSAWLEGAK